MFKKNNHSKVVIFVCWYLFSFFANMCCYFVTFWRSLIAIGSSFVATTLWCVELRSWYNRIGFCLCFRNILTNRVLFATRHLVLLIFSETVKINCKVILFIFYNMSNLLYILSWFLKYLLIIILINKIFSHYENFSTCAPGFSKYLFHHSKYGVFWSNRVFHIWSISPNSFTIWEKLHPKNKKYFSVSLWKNTFSYHWKSYWIFTKLYRTKNCHNFKLRSNRALLLFI